MAMEEASGYCDHCQRPVLARRDGVNHVLHFLITVFTCGLWIIPWGLSMLTRGDYACPHCGGRARVAAG